MDAYPMVERCWERQQEGFLPSPPSSPPEDLRWYYADPKRSEGLPAPPSELVHIEWRAPDIPLTPTLVRGDLSSYS